MTGRVGRYALQEVIGVGSFATVHRAVDDRLESDVVVKVLAENHSLNPEVRERFIAEGRSLRRVRSPHVVTVHDIGESERQQPYLVLAHADRGTLAQRVEQLRRGGWRAGAADVLAVARALGAAVFAVHAAGLVHRDLSPANVLLTSVAGVEAGDVARETDASGTTGAVVAPGERLVLADLGLCKDLALHSGLTVAGGTSGFRPPEQRDAGTVDTRADLWALSALLMWLVEGSDPPARLVAVLRRSLADDPARRHPDVQAWLADVERAVTPGARGRSTPSGRPRRRRVLVAGTIALLLAIGLGAGLLLGRGIGPSATSGSATVAIAGPSSVAVGETPTFEARVDGARSWAWTLPDGTFETDVDRVVLRPTAPGTARLVLRAVDGSGREIRAVHDFVVVE